MTGIEIAGLVVALLSMIGGGVATGVQAKNAKQQQKSLEDMALKEQEEYNKRISDLDAALGTEAFKAPEDTAYGKGMLRNLTNQMEDERNRQGNLSAMTGQTPEAEIASRGKLQDAYGDAMGKIMANASGIQSQNRGMYYNQLSNLMAGKNASEYRPNPYMNQGWAQMAGQGADTALQLLQYLGSNSGS